VSHETPPIDSGPDRALLDVSLAAARNAAAFQREGAGRLSPDRWSEKGTSDFVTEVDRESERRILARIRTAFPGHRVLAEEGTSEEDAWSVDGDGPAGDELPTSDQAPVGTDRAHSGPGSAGGLPILWIVDPLDGTTNWLHGYPEYAVSIAALDERGLRTGVVLNAATGEEFTAVRGGGAFRNGEPIEVSGLVEARLALLGTGFPFKRADLLPGYLRVLGRLLQRTSGVRRAGAAALDLCDLACGRLDGFWEHWLMTWDVAAGALIVREAGGTFDPLPDAGLQELAAAREGGVRICDAFEGRGARDASGGGGFFATNGHLRAELETLWREAIEPGR
jgi:myo-inositol-1(or 4)-monophosphatase